MHALGHGKVYPAAREEHDKNYDEADSEPLHESHFFGIQHYSASSAERSGDFVSTLRQAPMSRATLSFNTSIICRSDNELSPAGDYNG